MNLKKHLADHKLAGDFYYSALNRGIKEGKECVSCHWFHSRPAVCERLCHTFPGRPMMIYPLRRSGRLGFDFMSAISKASIFNFIQPPHRVSEESRIVALGYRSPCEDCGLCGGTVTPFPMVLIRDIHHQDFFNKWLYSGCFVWVMSEKQVIAFNLAMHSSFSTRSLIDLRGICIDEVLRYSIDCGEHLRSLQFCPICVNLPKVIPFMEQKMTFYSDLPCLSGLYDFGYPGYLSNHEVYNARWNTLSRLNALSHGEDVLKLWYLMYKSEVMSSLFMQERENGLDV